LSQERLDRHDKTVLLIWILAGLLGAGVAHRYFFQAFPELPSNQGSARGRARTGETIRIGTGRATGRISVEHHFSG